MRQQPAIAEAIAHRGLRDKYPENSLPAFLAALEAGVDAIELDVHATRDNVIVVHHDAALPDASGSRLAARAIRTISSSDLATLELSAGIHVPSLAEVLRAIGPTAIVYIEIKARDIESLVAAVLREASVSAGRCAVHSFDHRIVRKFGTLAPEVPTGILQVGYPIDSASLLKAANARDLWQECEFIDAELVTSIHAAGGRVIAWTCNDAADWSRFRDLGVDGICTDKAAALVEWRG
jgi:glycerophosphoryl diester phosphodiesterase